MSVSVCFVVKRAQSFRMCDSFPKATEKLRHFTLIDSRLKKVKYLDEPCRRGAIAAFIIFLNLF